MGEKMVIYKNIAYLPTISVKQILNSIGDTNNIVELDAYRRIVETSEKRPSLKLPFVHSAIKKQHRLKITFKGWYRAGVKHQYGNFPTKDVLSFIDNYELGQRDVEDMVIQRLVLMCDNEELRKMFPIEISTCPNGQKVFVVTLKNTFHKRPPGGLRKELLQQMGTKITKLKFQLSSLDVKTLQTYIQWRVKHYGNLIKSPNEDVKVLRSCLSPLFSKGFRKVRSYVRKPSKAWEYVGSKEL